MCKYFFQSRCMSVKTAKLLPVHFIVSTYKEKSWIFYFLNFLQIIPHRLKTLRYQCINRTFFPTEHVQEYCFYPGTTRWREIQTLKLNTRNNTENDELGKYFDGSFWLSWGSFLSFLLLFFNLIDTKVTFSDVTRVW